MPETLKFIDLFAGIGGFHRALGDGLGHECVFASEISKPLQENYLKNFRGSETYLHGDIRKAHDDVPAHDILAGGFPCPSFSKSGKQHGRRESRGQLMREIVRIARAHKPSYVLLENVGNFERMNRGEAWKELRTSLERIGYKVQATEHYASGGVGLLSPHHFGHPHKRDRFYVVATMEELGGSPFKIPSDVPAPSLAMIEEGEPDAAESKAAALTEQQERCINQWNALLKAVPKADPVISPLWGDEAWETYPFKEKTPYACAESTLRHRAGAERFPAVMMKQQYVDSLPSYARTAEDSFPDWKVGFIEDSREWWGKHSRHLPDGWLASLKAFPPSLRKLEWNCGAEERDLWTKVLQFRPSGLRAKRYNTSPALVAMTSTQIPILGPRKRFLTRTEGLRLQGFPDDHFLPESRQEAFAALGNAVHVGVVEAVVRQALAA
jgi:DNA (cytosine-5)-methyltransferase 1